MNLKEALQKLVELQKKTQKIQFETIEHKKDEIFKYEKLKRLCEEKVLQLKEEMKENTVYIKKLEKIIKKL